VDQAVGARERAVIERAKRPVRCRGPPWCRSQALRPGQHPQRDGPSGTASVATNRGIPTATAPCFPGTMPHGLGRSRGDARRRVLRSVGGTRTWPPRPRAMRSWPAPSGCRLSCIPLARWVLGWRGRDKSSPGNRCRLRAHSYAAERHERSTWTSDAAGSMRRLNRPGFRAGILLVAAPGFSWAQASGQARRPHCGIAVRPPPVCANTGRRSTPGVETAGCPRRSVPAVPFPAAGGGAALRACHPGEVQVDAHVAGEVKTLISRFGEHLPGPRALVRRVYGSRWRPPGPVPAAGLG